VSGYTFLLLYTLRRLEGEEFFLCVSILPASHNKKSLKGFNDSTLNWIDLWAICLVWTLSALMNQQTNDKVRDSWHHEAAQQSALIVNYSITTTSTTWTTFRISIQGENEHKKRLEARTHKSYADFHDHRLRRRR